MSTRWCSCKNQRNLYQSKAFCQKHAHCECREGYQCMIHQCLNERIDKMSTHQELGRIKDIENISRTELRRIVAPRGVSRHWMMKRYEKKLQESNKCCNEREDIFIKIDLDEYEMNKKMKELEINSYPQQLEPEPEPEDVQEIIV